MDRFESAALNWATTHNLTPSQVRSATPTQIATAAGATLGQEGFFPQSVRRFVAVRMRWRAQDAERERLRALLETRVQQEYPQARSKWIKTPEYGRVLILYAMPIEDITGDG